MLLTLSQLPPRWSLKKKPASCKFSYMLAVTRMHVKLTISHQCPVNAWSLAAHAEPLKFSSEFLLQPRTP